MASDVPPWNVDFLDLLDCLREAHAEFMIVGAFALSQNGLPRATGDLDVFVRATPDNAPRVIEALRAFGAPLDSAGIRVDDFDKPGTTYQMGLPPRRIDVLTQLSGIDFDEAWASRVERPIGGGIVAFLGRDALIKTKRASARPKDLADVAALEALAAKHRG